MPRLKISDTVHGGYMTAIFKKLTEMVTNNPTPFLIALAIIIIMLAGSFLIKFIKKRKQTKNTASLNNLSNKKLPKKKSHKVKQSKDRLVTITYQPVKGKKEQKYHVDKHRIIKTKGLRSPYVNVVAVQSGVEHKITLNVDRFNNIKELIPHLPEPLKTTMKHRNWIPITYRNRKDDEIEVTIDSATIRRKGPFISAVAKLHEEHRMYKRLSFRKTNIINLNEITAYLKHTSPNADY
jgi:hypothetical protein